MSLEKHKFFPFIAWGLFIAFAAFTANLVYQLHIVTQTVYESSIKAEMMAADNSIRLDKLEETLEMDLLEEVE